MNLPPDEFDELRALLDALCEETITAEQVRRLEELVLRYPEAEAYYVQYMSLFADLGRHFAVPGGRAERSLHERLGARAQSPQAGGQEMKAPRAGRRASRSVRLLVSWSAAVAAGLLVAVALWPRPPVAPPLAEQGGEPLDDTVAVLVQASGAEWEDTGMPTRVGAPLPPGRLHLKAGVAQLEFYNGAIVILQGPADLRLVSRREAYCAQGKLRTTVPPPAQGFTIRSPKADLVDRGTEFGLQVDAGERTEVHVFEGKVELYDPGSDPGAAPHQDLTTGQGVRVDGPGVVRPIPPNPAAFLTARQLAARAVSEIEQRHKEWLAASAALRRDPDVVVYYPLQGEPAWSRVVVNQAAGRRQPGDGVIVGCTWGTGRWPGKQGLEFRQVSDRVRLHIPGQFDGLTLLAWVRVDALPNRYSSLLMTDGWEGGAPHWHIRQDGKISMGVQGIDRAPASHYFTSVVFTPERFGQWSQLAVVYDRDGGEVCHYLDGRRVKQTAVKLDIPLHLGDAEIGNWNTGSRSDKYPIRYLSGCMDEFVVFARALSGPEIERLYQQGRPPL
jgi:Concanavalin A-like lectin/glucanases superfamily/FecR protein